MKTIIAVSATGKRGKTTAIIRLAKEFPLSEREYFDYDGRALSEAEAVKMNKVLCRGVYEGKRIGFSSEGDNWSLVEHGLCTLTGNFSEKMPVDVIVAACRQRGKSPDAIRYYADSQGYEVVWTSHYRGATPKNANCQLLSNGTDLNGLFAEHITVLIKQLLR